MIKSAIYTAHAHTTGGRIGKSATNDGRISVDLSSPKEMGGDGGPGTNPEQLFAMGYSACFLGAIKAISHQKKVELPDSASIDAAVHFGEQAEGVGFGIGVELKIALPGMDKSVATDLVEAAHQICPYSNATRGNVDVKISIVE